MKINKKIYKSKLYTLYMKRYKLVKYQSGGETYRSIANPQWPPDMDKVIMAEHPSYSDKFIGTPIKKIWNDTAVVLALSNNKDYTEALIYTQNIIPSHNGRGLFVLTPSYKWNYVAKDIIHTDIIPKTEEKKYLYQTI